MPRWGLRYYLLIFKEKLYVKAHLRDLASYSQKSIQINNIVVDTRLCLCYNLLLWYYHLHLKGVKMNLKPIHDRIVIRLVEAETQTKSGIFIPDAAVEKPSQGDVVAAGPGRTTEDGQLVPNAVKLGDRVLFGKHAATPIKVEGEELHILREDDVLAIVE